VSSFINRSLAAITIPALLLALASTLALGLPEADARSSTSAASAPAGLSDMSGQGKTTGAPELQIMPNGQLAVSSGDFNLSTIATSAYGDRAGPVRFSER